MTTDENRQGNYGRRAFLKHTGRTIAALASLGVAGSLWGRSGNRTTKRNIVLVLSDDHRYDFMGFMTGAPAFLETPNMDRMAKQGAHLANAFVSTSLCSPSRASIVAGRPSGPHSSTRTQ